MKLLQAILVAVFCATIVSAAPPLSSSFSFQDFAPSKLIGEIENKIKEKFFDLECVRNVITKVIGDSEFKAAWDKTNTKLDNLINVEWPKCLEIEDFPTQQGCKTTVVGKALQAVGLFIKDLALKSKWRLIKEINDKVSAECYEHTNFNDLENEADPSMARNIEEKIKCTIEVTSEALKDTDYATIWEETKKELEKLHERIKACKSQASLLEVVKCIAKEANQFHEIISKFFGILHHVNKETYEHVKKAIKEKCFQ
ncbi:uncharacterized protein LOC129571856 [Sitodiplosis mosellana]|uniref:uncharacterized protein LOC129571856 n=1 Tax=Sitodiplosis mosellana TaxID=263140 RepID=UPI002444C0B6|nr:uncharacterized protein LOC129571856 [Sitodiplosis mosellana]